MTRLDVIVEKVVDSYRLTFLIASATAIVLTALQQNWIGLIVIVPILVLMYFAGLFLVGFVLSKLIHPTVLIEDIRNRRIAEINRRLDAGELVAEVKSSKTRCERQD